MHVARLACVASFHGTRKNVRQPHAVQSATLQCTTQRGTLSTALRLQVPLSEEEQTAKAARPDKMAIGGNGGFQVRKRL